MQNVVTLLTPNKTAPKTYEVTGGGTPLDRHNKANEVPFCRVNAVESKPVARTGFVHPCRGSFHHIIIESGLCAFDLADTHLMRPVLTTE